MKILLTALSVLALGTTTGNLSNFSNINSKNKLGINNFYVLGDSLSDNGAGIALQNFNLQFNPSKDFDSFAMAGLYYNNSYTNGPVAAELLSSKLGLKLIPAWNFNLKGKNSSHVGNNYAIGGETAGEYLQQDLGTINKQVDALLIQHKIKQNDVIFFEIGGNDFLNTGGTNTHWYEIIDKAITSEEQALINLINNGAKNIIATNLPNLGLLPNLTMISSIESTLISIIYNLYWIEMIHNINLTHSNIIKTYNLFSFMNNSYYKFINFNYNVTSEATHTDLEIINRVATYSSIYNDEISINNIDKYYFFDNIHPTRFIHKWWAEDMYNKFF